MINEREDAFKNISRTLAITRYDIEQRQSINEYALNIHGENYFRDIFNYIYDLKLENANFESQNEACIDLIDKSKKLAYQITTTKTSGKIQNTFDALNKDKYKDYDIKIFYLLEKANPNKTTKDSIQEQYGIDISDCLIDYTNLITDINDLQQNKLMELNRKFFRKEDFYTDEIVLNLAFTHLLKNKGKVKPNYNDDFGSIDTNEKLELNQINPRIQSKINDGLDYREILNSIDEEDNILTELRSFVVEGLYNNILKTNLSSKVSRTTLENLSILELHNLAREHQLDFNKLINSLHYSLENYIEIQDYNSTSISWIIIAFFFELCDVGAKQ